MGRIDLYVLWLLNIFIIFLKDIRDKIIFVDNYLSLSFPLKEKKQKFKTQKNIS